MPNVLLIGCGKMGSAMLDGWIRQGKSPTSIIVIEPTDIVAKELHKKYGITVYTTRQEIHPNFQPDVVIFAIKPQLINDVVPGYAKIGHQHTVFITIAAGKTIRTFEHFLGEDKAIVRVMPNLPAIIGMGAIVACPNTITKPEQKKHCTDLLSANGTVYWINDENQMDAITAISGSGPAYIFYFIECLTACAKSLGLPEELARSLVSLTVHGSSELASKSENNAEELRKQVTSPHGTTQAALDILMAPDGLLTLLEATTTAACDRSRELAD